MVKFRGTFIFDAKHASTILSAVDRVEGDLVKIEDSITVSFKPKALYKRKTVAEKVEERLHKKKGGKFRKGKWWKTTAVELLKGIFEDGNVHNTQELYVLLAKEGYASNSISPRLVELIKKGYLQSLGDGNYQKTNV